MRDFFARDVAQTSMALSQLVKERNLRMMGSLDPEDTERMVHVVLQAHQLVNACEMFLWSYYMPLFAQYWALRRRFERYKMYRKVGELTFSLQSFRGPYSLFMVCHEAGMTIFDMKFKQYHTVATMLGLDEKEEPQPKGPTWMAADAGRIDAMGRAQFAAKDRAGSALTSSNKKSQFPPFEEAVEIARLNMDEFLKISPKIPGEQDRPPVLPEKTGPKKNNTKRGQRNGEKAPPEEPNMDDLKVDFFDTDEDTAEGA
jgi:hypothetical protein